VLLAAANEIQTACDETYADRRRSRLRPGHAVPSMTQVPLVRSRHHHVGRRNRDDAGDVGGQEARPMPAAQTVSGPIGTLAAGDSRRRRDMITHHQAGGRCT
jgi:hypothetical protein